MPAAAPRSLPWIGGALALAFVCGLARGEDPPPAPDDPPFLVGDTHTCKQPPLRVTRPSDAWQFVDLARVGRASGGTKFQLWYGAARANIIINAWVEGLRDEIKKDPSGHAVEQRRRQLEGTVRELKVVRRKRVKIGKRVGALLVVTGKVPARRDPTRLRPITIEKAICYRPEDSVFLEVHLEFEDPRRTKQLEKDFKKLLKKVRF